MQIIHTKPSDVNSNFFRDKRESLANLKPQLASILEKTKPVQASWYKMILQYICYIRTVYSHRTTSGCR